MSPRLRLSAQRFIRPLRHLGGLLGLVLIVGCDHGLVPPEPPPAGAIRAFLTYVDAPAAWPAPAAVRDLRFVALRFVPRDTADFLQLNRMAISDRLAYGVSADTILLGGVAAGVFPYAGVAQRFDEDLLSWRPVGLYDDDGGLFFVAPGETTEVRVLVDFRHPPPFPPSGL